MTDNLYIERRVIRRGSLSQDIASHLYARQWHGTAIVVSDKPKVLLSSVMKQWVELARKVQRERASTLSASRIQELSHIVNHMEHLRMAAKSSVKQAESDVLFVLPSDVAELPVDCRTVYIACANPNRVIDQVEQILAQGVVVCY
jgi:hypothetical protein